MSEKKQTAVEWFYDKIKSHFEHDGDLLETLTFTMAIAKQKEREQHKAHDDRGHVFVRSFCDFDARFTYRLCERGKVRIYEIGELDNPRTSPNEWCDRRLCEGFWGDEKSCKKVVSLLNGA
jgi:hypothetical protein